MKKRKIKKIAKRRDSLPRIFPACPNEGASQPVQPVIGKVKIGSSTINVHYADKIGDIVSLESSKLPIIHEKKVNRPGAFVSKVLDSTGFESLKEIADAIKGKL